MSPSDRISRQETPVDAYAIDVVHNLIRGCDPGAWRLDLGQRHQGQAVRSAQAPGAPLRGRRRQAPGEITSIGERSISISVQGGVVEIFKVRTEAGQNLSGAGLAEAFGLKPGMKVEAPVTAKAAEPVA
ncbi:hypothetical protein QEZ47_24640 [Aminobacter anthyllidis]|uniref:hypothetical protein n=1 Tax=Aminobacter anthyllidis TaxID=1035067 RepID=UPI002458115E|nr:hypothetical protein [Aminobacter anthyllidis]MDH4988646.1 hypothetical protein [Aminobacter anthyllidis]